MSNDLTIEDRRVGELNRWFRNAVDDLRVTHDVARFQRLLYLISLRAAQYQRRMDREAR